MSSATVARAAIVGTAGHIDHGKSALIERLTGIHTDRLPEEKKRGISIELGFAFLDLPSGRRVGIVDVPGHERFVKQMLAGAGGMDLVLLVVAADEGVMPQTREHLEIVNLLDIPDGFVVVTKTDLVPDDEWLDIVDADITNVIAGTVFEGKPIVRCSAKTGEGVADVRREIESRLADEAFVARGRETRLPVDRIFTLQGFGTVVTGTLWNGSLGVGDPVVVLPEGIETRVKTVQVHDTEVERASAGQRVALSLHRVEKDRLHRGAWVVKSDVLTSSHMMDAWFRLLPSAPKALANRARVRVHIGASELLARLVLLDRDEIEPGQRAPVQLRLESPGVAEAGDRFVVRSYSPMRTIGGGTIVVPVAAKRRRHHGDPAAELRRLEEGTPVDRLCDLLGVAGLDGESAKNLRASLGMPAPEFAALAAEARDAGRVVGENRLFLQSALDEAVDRVAAEIALHHREHPYRWGIGIGELKGRLGRDMNPALFDAARRRAVEAGRVRERGEQIADVDQSDALPDEVASLAGAIDERLEAEGFAVSLLSHVIKTLGVEQGPDLIARLVFEGRLVQISNEYAFTSARVLELRERLRRFFTEHETLSVGDAKDVLDGVSRKHAVPILEYCDRVGWTRRAGDGRVAGAGLSGG